MESGRGEVPQKGQEVDFNRGCLGRAEKGFGKR